jgi:hypothetical protein
MILRATLIVLTALLLAAHFLRAGNIALVVVCLIAPLLLLIKQRWSLIALQLFAYASAVIWLITLLQLVSQRIALGRSWGGVVAILGTVTLVAVLAGLSLNSPGFKTRYTSDQPDPPPAGPAQQSDN